MGGRGAAARPAAQPRLHEAQEVVGELLARVRALSLELWPTVLDDLGLMPTLIAHGATTAA